MNVKNNVTGSRRYLQGLKAAASGNAQAFGFSILITVSYGIVATSTAPPVPAEQIGFAMAAVAAFSLLNVVIAYLAKGESGRLGSDRILLIATATDFMAVGAGLAAAMGINAAISGWPTWILTPFVAGVVYLMVQACELALGQEADGP